MWSDSIKLPVELFDITNENGYDKKIQEFISGIPANFKSTTRSDETLASQVGYTADVIVEIMSCNYNGQKFLIDEKNDQEYEIKRTHEVYGKETIELTCQRR